MATPKTQITPIRAIKSQICVVLKLRLIAFFALVQFLHLNASTENISKIPAKIHNFNAIKHKFVPQNPKFVLRLIVFFVLPQFIF